MSKKINIAVIGGGINSTIGNAHYKAMSLQGDFNINSGFFSKNKKINLKTGISLRVNKNKIYNNYIDLINKEKKNIDFFLVLTPTSSHFEVLKYLIKSNLNIICEKPVVANLKEVNEIKKISKNYKKKFVTIFNYTGYPAVREIEKILKKKKIGKIMHFIFKMPQETFLKNKKKQIQKWRLVDKNIPTISQDLTVHLVNMIDFLFKSKPKKMISFYSKNVKNFHVYDDCKSFLKFQNINGLLWVSKSALGEKNGLSLEIYGDKGSIIWNQQINEIITLNFKNGEKKIIDRSCKCFEMNKKRYQRYRPGHPAGYIEAFANYYEDIKNYFFKNKKTYLFGLKNGLNSVEFIHLLNESNNRNQWLKIKK